jgi:hypothetical protein
MLIWACKNNSTIHLFVPPLNTEVDASNTLVRATSMNGKVTASTSQDCFSDIHYLFIVEDLARRILSISSQVAGLIQGSLHNSAI